MTIGLIIIAAALIAVLQKHWAPRSLKHLKYKGACDRIMAQPGEMILWQRSIDNNSRLPVSFVRLREVFPHEATIHMDTKWMDRHYKRGLYQLFIEERLTIGPKRRWSNQVPFSISQRGKYDIGKYRMGTGDLLGFQETYHEGDGDSVVIIPEKAKNPHAFQAVSGFLGDISVRRFILEDPVLTVGFRDYTGREPMKSISWTRSATAGQLQVKQYDYTAEQTVMILLNVEDSKKDTFEACLRLMRTVCESLEKAKIPYGLRTNGNLPATVGNIFFLAEGLGKRHLDTILYALGCADDTRFYSFHFMVQNTLQHRKNNEAYIVVTPKNTADVLKHVKQLESACGNPVCVLTGESEVEAP
jgi:hypothetical protein